MKETNILYQFSGSIACYKSCYVLSYLVQKGYSVKVACTRAALRFIGLSTLEGLSHNPVYWNMFERNRAMDHIHLAKWADLAILCPASANQINQLASGKASNCLGALFLAYDLSKPYILAPAMNQQMYKHPAVLKSLSMLREWNVKILPCETGLQACGDYGEGKLLDPNKIIEEIEKLL